MSKIKFLDCTLRDGGYINDWNFGKENIRDIINRLSNSNVEIIECGFLTSKKTDENKSLFNNISEIDELLPDNCNNTFAAMIAIGEKEMNPILLPDAENTRVSAIRLTFHPEEIEKAFCYGEMIMEKGYKLFMQPVGTGFYSDDDLIKLIKRVNALNPYAFYIVDTLGTMFGKMLLRQIYIADHNLSENIKLGYHSHNNLQMSFANAQCFLEHKSNRYFIIDCTADGMGRGAGNLCTELILNYFNSEYENRYNVLPILEIVDKYILPISIKVHWGYSSSYFLASTKMCHPNYASYIMSRQTVSVSTVAEILDQIPSSKREKFNENLIEKLYQSYQSNAVDDMEVIDHLRNLLKTKKVLILAPGKSIISYKEQIDKIIEEEKPFVIATNFIPEDYVYDLVFITNDRRFDECCKKIDWERLVVTSNIHHLAENASVINYSSLLNTSFYVSDSSTTMLLKLLVKCAVKDVMIAGMDGFTNDPFSNYYSPNYVSYTYDIPLQTKNEQINIQLNKRAKEMNLTLVTPSIYKLNTKRNDD
jgi:4-hydroxy 2-oxovalerate aldolase